VRRLLIPLLVLLLHSSLTAQPATRLGVYEGIGFSAITYNFLGRMHDRKLESMPLIGLTLEFPLSDNVLLALRPAMTTLNGTAGLAARRQDEAGSTYHRSSIKEQWVLEVPILAKYLFSGKEVRPSFNAGGFIYINGSPAEIRVMKDSDPSYEESVTYPILNGGVMATFGLEIDASPMLLIIPEIGVRQQLFPSIDTEIITQNNNPRFFFCVGIVFTLEVEKWR